MLISETKLRLHAKKRLVILLEVIETAEEGSVEARIANAASAELIHLVQELTGSKIKPKRVH